MESAPQAQEKIALWVVPRSVSTAFERVFIEREDTTVVHEPFGVYYYNSSERRHDRFIEAYPPKPEYEFDHIMREKVLKPHDKPVWFMKDMPYHVTARLTVEFARLFHNTFLIRKPDDAVASHYKLSPDLTLEEAGYADQYRLFEMSMNECKEEPVVVDADDFRLHADDLMRQYCEKVDIEHKPEAMQWEQRDVEIWKISESWHKDALASTGVTRPKQKEQEELPPHILDIVDQCTEFYREMYRHRLIPSS